ncbi:MAG: helix-turn-helix transcriptional regulator [Gemmatimonadetes bacterium]|nr:helix-turn-helix transcriptional regulator [Gemmatimonadota bacterium]
MSKIRQGPALRSATVGFSSGYHWRAHRSAWGQLVWASRGVITVHVGDAIWVVPPAQAVWMPPGFLHGVHMAGQGVLRRVYLQRASCRRLPAEPRVIRVAPLLRELLRRALQLGTLDRAVPSEARLLALLLDELVVVHVVPVELPVPADPRARRAADFARADPAAARDLHALARHANASVRTLERLFTHETGLSLGAWRQRARLVHAMTMLADGATVSQCAFAVGYASVSAFVAAFRRGAGVTPGKYVSMR